MKMEIEDSRFIAGIYSTAKDKEETTLKKAFSLFLTIAIVFSLAACNQNEDKGKSASPPPESIAADSAPVEPSGETQPEIEQETQSQAPSEATTGSNILTAYFSWADNAVLTEDVDAVSSPSVIPPGNVQQLAGWVQEETGGDLFSIRVTEPYPSDWDACLERANEERGSGARPELQENVSNLEQYDTVFLGYPNWWYGAPMALLSFLEQNDLSGKDVYLFCSHGTGGSPNGDTYTGDSLLDIKGTPSSFGGHELSFNDNSGPYGQAVRVKQSGTNYINFTFTTKAIICLICLICIFKYAPADTHKRPIINAKKRKRYKIISFISGSIFTILILVYNTNILSNYLLVGMIYSVIMIHPLVYKIFKLPYANYKNYNLGLSN